MASKNTPMDVLDCPKDCYTYILVNWYSTCFWTFVRWVLGGTKSWWIVVQFNFIKYHCSKFLLNMQIQICAPMVKKTPHRNSYDLADWPQMMTPYRKRDWTQSWKIKTDVFTPTLQSITTSSKHRCNTVNMISTNELYSRKEISPILPNHCPSLCIVNGALLSNRIFVVLALITLKFRYTPYWSVVIELCSVTFCHPFVDRLNHSRLSGKAPVRNELLIWTRGWFQGNICTFVAYYCM